MRIAGITFIQTDLVTGLNGVAAKTKTLPAQPQALGQLFDALPDRRDGPHPDELAFALARTSSEKPTDMRACPAFTLPTERNFEI